MTEVDWTGDLAIRLVEEYRQRPVLWDPMHESYRNQTAKYCAWSDMARVFECDIADLRKKLNSVFASYRREKGKIRSGGRSTWFLYNYLQFLPNHLDPKTKGIEVIVGTNDAQVSQNSDRSNQTSEDEEEDDREEREIVIKQEPIVETYCIEDPSSPPSPRKIPDRHAPLKKYRLSARRLPLRRKVVKPVETTRDNLDSRLLETLRLLRKSDLSRKKDECDSFGEYIAVSLRKHDERTQSMIKQAINNILFEQEMKKYSAGQYSIVISGVDENPLVIGDQDDK